MKRQKWAAGSARDPHHEKTPEKPGALRPLLNIVERVIPDLERLIQWEFTPPIVLQELDAKHTPTGQPVRLAWLDEGLRAAVAKARTELLRVREALRKDTERHRGKKVKRVQPYPVSARSMSSAAPRAARRRDLVEMVRTEILRLHPKQATRPRAARAQAARLASDIIASIRVLD